MKKYLLIACFTAVCIPLLKSQNIKYPNFALKSHETLVITRIDINPKAAIVYLSLENKREGGTFCADKNIFIVYPDGTRSRLTSSKGIPVCPAVYKFKAIGEKLSFELTFPALRSGTKWVDLIEDCADNCFSFYGVCLNAGLNIKIDAASVLAESGESSKALMEFLKIADSAEIRESGQEGLIYMNIIKLSKETGNVSEATRWYGKLKSIEIPHSGSYIKHLNSQGIIY